jgi:hypothetical protein
LIYINCRKQTGWITGKPPLVFSSGDTRRAIVAANRAKAASHSQQRTKIVHDIFIAPNAAVARSIDPAQCSTTRML